jgi:hypothetical protein
MAGREEEECGGADWKSRGRELPICLKRDP